MRFNSIEPIRQIRNNMLGVTVINGAAMVSSRDVAAMFEKRHDHVVRDVEVIIENLHNPNFGAAGNDCGKYFKVSCYRDAQKKKRIEYLMNRDGFTLLAMGFTGIKAMKFKIAYINQFNKMERFIHSRNLARIEYPELAEMIKLMHDEPKFYHFSNEANMMNKIVLGMTAKQFRARNGIDNDVALRDCLTLAQSEMIQKLQKVDAGLVVAIPDYKERERALRAYHEKLRLTTQGESKRIS